MGERSSELEDNRISISANDSETAGLEIGAPTTFATTTLDEDLRSDGDDSSEVHTTAGGTTIDSSAEPEEIKSQIEQTRNEMSETINAIQEKLSISNLVESAKDEVSEQITSVYQSAKDALFGSATGKVKDFMAKVKNNVDRFSNDYGPAIGDATQTVVRTAKSNPIPFALIGLGIGILIFNSRNKTQKVKSYRYNERFDGDDLNYDYPDTELQNFAPSNRQSTMKRAYGKVTSAAGQATETVGNVASSAYSGVADAASTAYSGVADAASTAYSGVGSVAEKAYEQVGNLGTGAKQAASWTQETYSQQLEENPLAVGAVAFTLGAVVGLSLPSTEIEGQYLGETRNNLLQQAQDAAGGLISQAQQVVGDVTKNVKDEAKAQGFSA